MPGGSRPGGACGAAETQHAHTTTQPMTAMRTQPSGRTALMLDLAQIPLALFDGPFAICRSGSLSGSDHVDNRFVSREAAWGLGRDGAAGVLVGDCPLTIARPRVCYIQPGWGARCFRRGTRSTRLKTPWPGRKARPYDHPGNPPADPVKHVFDEMSCRRAT